MRGKSVGEKGPESTLEKLSFWYPYDLGTLYQGKTKGQQLKGKIVS